MNRILHMLFVLSCLFSISGCVSNSYQVTPEIYREKVKVLGVLPVIVDTESTILHPQRGEVLALLQQSAADKYLRLSQDLSASAGYSAVRPVIIDEKSEMQLFAEKLLKTNDDGSYRTYQPAREAVVALAQSAGVDGLLVVILNGVESKERRWERLSPRYLDASFNEIQATAMVLAATGEVLWEKNGASGSPFVDLQYADFDEAYHNRTDQVAVHFITVDGLSRALLATDKGLFDKEPFSTLYGRLFDKISAELKVVKFWQKKQE